MSSFAEIEKKWQNKWEAAKLFNTENSSKKKKFYCLEMFPYPSASFLHMGHVRNYTIGDIIARFKRMNGFNVLYPMGYDSFGLPAENAAKKQGIHPKKYTEQSIKQIMNYQKALGNSYDWERVIAAHEPEYYKWNQYFFLKFLEKGLVYRKKAPVNWCPECKSTLANEEVVSGKCWRHETMEVEQKELEQWFLKITDYADELLTDINKLEWSERIKALQKNWIGKSEGVIIDFHIKGSENKLQVFTTRPDTIFGVTFLVISPKHSLIKELAKENKKELELFAKKAQNETEKEKEGVFLGSFAMNPFTNEEVPIYAANFVVAEYGTGAVMAVPAHDKRDFDFAKKYSIPIKTVIAPKENENPNRPRGAEYPAINKNFIAISEAYVNEGVLVNSEQFNGINSSEAITKIIAFAENKKFAKKTTQYKIRDWLISRQRYWGTPIPIIYCKKCGMIPIPEKELPVILPESVDFKKEGNPLNHAKEWVETSCPKCKSKAQRETDTMGGFVDSSWYFLRFCSPKIDTAPFDKKAVEQWMPVDQYIGGIEHAVGHLIYSRFWTKALRDLGMLKIDEPFTKLFNQGIVYKDGHKMSKSFGNVVNQTDIAEKYGIDTARLFLMSVASPESDMEWNDNGVEGSYRLLQKITRLAEIAELSFKKSDSKDEHKRNSAIKKYTQLLEEFKFNTAIIEFTNYVDYLSAHPTKIGFETALKLLSPFAPHTAEELWNKIGNTTFISIEQWPTADESKILLEIEYAETFVESIIADAVNVIQLAKISSPKKINIIVAENWKYSLFLMLKEQLQKTRDFSAILKIIMASELKKYGKIIPPIVQRLLKEPSKFPAVIYDQEKELSFLLKSEAQFKKETSCTVKFVKEQDSEVSKAKQALPGKPAIIVE